MSQANQTNQPNHPPKSCDSCLMPFSKDTGTREHPNYCSLCFNDGQLCYSGNNLAEFQAVCYASMRQSGVAFIPAKVYTYMIRFAPRWKKQRR